MSTKIGDLIIILPDARVPFILRAEQDAGYSLVGEAYVHSIMRSEAFDFLNGKTRGSASSN